MPLKNYKNTQSDFKGGLIIKSVYGVLGKSCLLGAMLSRVPGWEGEASPPTAKACSPRGEAMLSRWDLKVACPRKAAAKAWHPADITFPGCYNQLMSSPGKMQLLMN